MTAHTSRPGTKSNYDAADDAKDHKKHRRQHSGGEPKKTALKLHENEAAEIQAHKDISEGQDNKKGNIGPSGQGTHRGREARNRQTKDSGRSDVASDTMKNHPG